MVLGGLDGGFLVQARAASKPARWSLAGYSLACQDADSRPASDTAIRSISAKMTRAFRSSTETSAARPASNLAERSANRRALSASRTPARATPALPAQLARATATVKPAYVAALALPRRHQGIEKRVFHGRNYPHCCHGCNKRPRNPHESAGYIRIDSQVRRTLTRRPRAYQGSLTQSTRPTPATFLGDDPPNPAAIGAPPAKQCAYAIGQSSSSYPYG